MDDRIEETAIDDLLVVHTPVYQDERGQFQEIHSEERFASQDIPIDFERTFYSQSDRDVLRGLHLQLPPFQEAKLVSCLHGKIFDVAVDLRPDSETYGEAVTACLSGTATASLCIPRGFAHGFVALADDSIVHYMSDNEYAPDHQSGIHWADESVGVDWPVTDPIVSEKDQNLGSLAAFGQQFRSADEK